MLKLRTFIIIFVMAASFLVLQHASRSKSIPPKLSFNTFPLKIGLWRGQRDFFNQKVYDILGVDDSILINYRSKNKKLIQLYVGYYRSQKKGDLIHSPKNCMPGSGWKISKTDIIKIPVKDKDINTITLNLEKNGEKQIALYWFQSRGRIISSEYMQKIWLVIDSVTKRRTDGSFVRIIAIVDDNPKETLNSLKSFVKEVYPYLKEYIPS